MQGYFIVDSNSDIFYTVCKHCVDYGKYSHSLKDRNTVTIGKNFAGTVQCGQCEATINGEPDVFTVVSADADEVLSWARTVDLEYAGDTYSIDLSWNGYDGYEWTERDCVPDGLRELLDGMDLFDLDEQSAAVQ